MPRFTALPIVVEAYQFHGTVHDLPIEYAAHLTQEFVGEKACLPSSLVGEFVEGELKYSAYDEVYPGDWIVRGERGFYKMGQGEFERAFEMLDEEPMQPEAARWNATFVGADDGSSPGVLHWLGYVFRLGEPVGINDPGHARLIAGNGFFFVIDTQAQEAAHDTNGGAAGGEGSAQAGRVDRGGSEYPVGHGDVDAAELGDPGSQRDGDCDTAIGLAFAGAKRKPGRPRRADLASAGV